MHIEIACWPYGRGLNLASIHDMYDVYWLPYPSHMSEEPRSCVKPKGQPRCPQWPQHEGVMEHNLMDSATVALGSSRIIHNAYFKFMKGCVLNELSNSAKGFMSRECLFLPATPNAHAHISHDLKGHSLITNCSWVCEWVREGSERELVNALDSPTGTTSSSSLSLPSPLSLRRFCLLNVSVSPITSMQEVNFDVSNDEGSMRIRTRCNNITEFGDVSGDNSRERPSRQVYTPARISTSTTVMLS